MKVAIYGDAHITRKMGNIQNIWNESVIKIFHEIYNDFESNSVEMAVCLGDLFDKAVLEAKSVKLVLEVLSILNNSTFPTYVLLGNHEIDNQEHNVLEYLSEYENIIPVTSVLSLEEKFTFIPYSVPIEDVPSEYIDGRYIFTHHDIYGSELASGKVRASFGTDPNILSTAKLVFNGHIHLYSHYGNIINVGSITKMQQGELKLYETPIYLYLDTERDIGLLNTKRLENHFIAYLTIDLDSLESPSLRSALSLYKDTVRFVLRLSYKGEDISIDSVKDDERILSISLRKKLLDSIESDNAIRKNTLDIKEFLSNYINEDKSLEDSEKPSMIEIGLSLLGGVCNA